MIWGHYQPIRNQIKSTKNHNKLISQSATVLTRTCIRLRSRLAHIKLSLLPKVAAIVISYLQPLHLCKGDRAHKISGLAMNERLFAGKTNKASVWKIGTARHASLKYKLPSIDRLFLKRVENENDGQNKMSSYLFFFRLFLYVSFCTVYTCWFVFVRLYY